jgi:hypothetical protein
MKTVVHYNKSTGVISQTSMVDLNSLPHLTGDFIIVDDFSSDYDNTHYVHGKNICQYTKKELENKTSLASGWTWKMPERIAVDLRTDQEKLKQNIQYVSVTRAVSYPPLTDLADALYWQAKGVHLKMEAYLAAVDLVKQNNPKVKE